ncbi:hypothetical protein [Methylobacterium isbiliense]|jgi:hypothetical protein|uniref:Uncharacterized protein n=1 Tax=Methylobacterium isbiliense TaxID=315478 RepID=A0ABQ4SMD9_9HYPH|nr:hypothetical protein [Methylobacterium isbiliense]MDN3627147.1 hypothetical protein [Methylobacterium isbiliense]GJE03598.1 hypothetical protein GMJLKIPL_5555 [Methylobacterium isbiliense]
MKLADWMREERMTARAVASAVTERLPPGESCSASAVEKWRAGVRVPRRRKMQAIITISEGRVTANDFTEASASGERTS